MTDSNQMAPGYSGTPLVKKLGIKPGCRLRVRNAPGNYTDLISPIPEGAKVSTSIRSNIDIWHLFSASRNELARTLEAAMHQIRQDGMIWVSWPKKSSGVLSEITEDTIREIALPMGLVDVKVCAVDEVWSGLKLVIRKENRRVHAE